MRFSEDIKTHYERSFEACACDSSFILGLTATQINAVRADSSRSPRTRQLEMTSLEINVYLDKTSFFRY